MVLPGMNNYSVPAVVALTLWGILAAAVSGYTYKAFKETL